MLPRCTLGKEGPGTSRSDTEKTRKVSEQKLEIMQSQVKRMALSGSGSGSTSESSTEGPAVIRSAKLSIVRRGRASLIRFPSRGVSRRFAALPGPVCSIITWLNQVNGPSAPFFPIQLPTSGEWSVHRSAQCAYGSAHGKMCTLGMGSSTRVHTFF